MGDRATDKSATEEVDLTSISSMLDVILASFNLIQKPAQNVPPALMLIGKNLRPGMSARNLAARTISQVERETGASMGNVFPDGPNVRAMMIKAMSEQVVSMIQTEAKVQININPGAILSVVTGVAGIIPVTGTGSNTLPVSGSGGVM